MKLLPDPLEVIKGILLGPGKFATWLMYDSNDDKPVPFVDDEGKPVRLDAENQPISRPSGLDPNFFVRQGLKDKKILNNTSDEDISQVGVYRMFHLAMFGGGQPWDAQMLSGNFDNRYVDAATILIGLYCAASDMSLEHRLEIQNFYAGTFSRMKDREFNPVYKNLPVRNVENTKIGYRLFESGKVGAGSKP